MDELFNVHFTEGNRHLTYLLTPQQSIAIYQAIGGYLATAEAAAGFDLEFTKSDPGEGECPKAIYKLDTADTFILYRRLGTYLQKRYPGSEPRLQVHGADF